MNLQEKGMLTSEDIYEDLCNKIEKLEYMPGQGISENELCKKYNVSRHMIRGAFTKLKDRKLIEVYPQRGTFISLIDMKYIEDILFLREAIEQEAIAKVIQSGGTDELCKQMKANLKLQKESWNIEGYSNEFYELDSKFHKLLLQSVGKADILEFLSIHYIHVRRWRNFEIRSSQRMTQLIDEHEQIIDALEKKDAAGARRAMHIHLDTVGRYGESFGEKEQHYFVKNNI